MPIVLPDKKALVLKLQDPSKVMTLLPKYKLLEVQGHRLVAVPHNWESVKVLQNVGIKAPEPIRHHYGWSGPKNPFATQLETAAFLSMNRRAYCLNSMGTGKTMSSLWAFDYLRSIGKVKRALVIAPLSTLERTWADEVLFNFPHLETAVLHGARNKRLKLLESDADIYVINHDGLGIVEEALAKRKDIDLVIIDELAVYRNAQTDRWKVVNRIVNKQLEGNRWAWGLTGTPIPNDPTDAFAQCRLVTPNTVPSYFTRFKDMVMRQVTQFLWVPRPDAVDRVYEVMQPGIRFSLDECTDLPEQTLITREVPLSKEQDKAYKDMFNKLRMEFESGEVQAVNEAVKAAKLMQIACGVVYDAEGGTIELPMKARLDTLWELVEESEGKVLVFVPFTGALNAVAEYLSKKLAKSDSDKKAIANSKREKGVGLSPQVGIVNGGTSKAERDHLFGALQRGSVLHVLVANPKTMSHGLTLTAATTIVWYGPTTSNETFEQANARVRRPGQTRSTVIATIESTPVERKIYDRLHKKQSTQGVLLNMFKNP